ncbi:MAG: flagellar motor protein MotA [Arcobacter sp.]|nr:MAG: flagellar motor protein MotA [Arcobacter sp.]
MKKFLAILLALTVAASAANQSDLERAYAKEFAYLKAQKQMLTTRLKEVKSTQSKKLSTAKRDLGVLQNVVLKKNALSEKLEDELFSVRQNAQVMTDDTSLIETVMMQSTTTLKPFGIDVVVDVNNYQASLETVFIKSNDLIKKLSTVRTENGKFYVEDGSEKTGRIIKIGNIASYGISEDISGALVPAGAGKLKVWNGDGSSESANALANGTLGDEINIFLYENKNKEIEESAEKTILSVINSGGLIGWIIIVLGLAALVLVVLRILFLMSASKSNVKLAASALSVLLTDGKEKALASIKDQKGSTARVIKATIRNLDRDREHIEDIVAESILHESGRLDRFGSMILIVAAVAPLLGLLGTVTGMIATFDIITEFGTGDPKLLSGGISIALVTTELGLIVAIPVLMLGNTLSAWAERIKDSMEHSALHLINEYSKQS